MSWRARQQAEHKTMVDELLMRKASLSTARTQSMEEHAATQSEMQSALRAANAVADAAKASKRASRSGSRRARSKKYAQCNGRVRLALQSAAGDDTCTIE